MKRQSNREENESSVDYWTRECPGMFLYVITFGPEPRRRKRRRRPAPIVPRTPPTISPPTMPAAPTVQVAEPAQAKSREFA